MVIEQERLGVLGDGTRRANTAQVKKDNLESSTKTAPSMKGSFSASTGPGGKRDLGRADGVRTIALLEVGRCGDEACNDLSL